MPREITYYTKYKASELRSLLLYILPVCLQNIQQGKYITHFQLFSRSIYVLLGTKITQEQLIECHNNLNQFVLQYQDFYGMEKMTMNIHLIKHLANGVQYLGPLWTNSLFVFEDYNGYLLKLVNGTQDVLAQITSKYCLAKSYNTNKYNAALSDCEVLGKGRPFNPESIQNVNEKSALFNFIQSVGHQHTNMQALKYLRIKKGHTIYTSQEYERATKTIDFFVGLSDGKMGVVKYYLEIEEAHYLMLHLFNAVSKKDQFIEVKPSSNFVIAPTVAITKKFMFVQPNLNMYAVERPNPYERD